MRDRLIELLKNNSHLDVLFGDEWEKAADELLANGVIVPPCKVGDTLYRLCASTRRIGEMQIVHYIVTELIFSTKRGARPWVICCFGGIRFDNLDFGKTVFLTKEEAEKALAERNKNN